MEEAAFREAVGWFRASGLAKVLLDSAYIFVTVAGGRISQKETGYEMYSDPLQIELVLTGQAIGICTLDASKTLGPDALGKKLNEETMTTLKLRSVLVYRQLLEFIAKTIDRQEADFQKTLAPARGTIELLMSPNRESRTLM